MKRLLLLAVCLFAQSAFFAQAAETPKLELRGALGVSGVGAILGQSAPTGTVNFLLGGTNTITTVGIGAGIGFFINPSIEILLSPSLSIVSSTATVSVVSFTVGPVFNFSERVQNSAFAFVTPGLVILSASSTTLTYFQFAIGGGKRFELGEQVSYAPMISYTGITSSPYQSGISIVPLQFSVFL